MTTKSLARDVYASYHKYKAFLGEILPYWDDLSKDEQQAWFVVAQQTLKSVANGLRKLSND